jgi:hypothetical protein
MPRVGEVFVPGGLPKITYNPRESLKLEERVLDYLDERHKILSLSGPTKFGRNRSAALRVPLNHARWTNAAAPKRLEAGVIS